MCVAVLGIIPGALAANAAQADPEFPAHVLGQRGFGVDLPADLQMNGQAHPCAGRRMIYQSHIDSAYVTFHEDKLRVLLVDGTKIVDPDTVCLRLAPDADKNGREVSRIVVPDAPGLSFLGAPGTIVWNAPTAHPEGWRPLWPGTGAFDPTHEQAVPKNLLHNRVALSLADVNGPGRVEVFNNGGRNRIASSHEEKYRTHFPGVGSHAHMDWAFSTAGIYQLGWEARVTRIGQAEEASPRQYMTWLIGSDAEVGLPEGTTVRLNKITKSAEDIRSEMGLKAPEGGSGGAGGGDAGGPGGGSGGVPAPVITAAQLEENFDDIFYGHAAQDLPSLHSAGDVVLSVSTDAKAELSRQVVHRSPDGTQSNLGRSGSSLAIGVPDAALKCVGPGAMDNRTVEAEGGWVYELPGQSTEGLARLVLSSAGVDYSLFKEGLPFTQRFDFYQGPQGFKIALANQHGSLTPQAVLEITAEASCGSALMDSDNKACLATMSAPAEAPVSMYFNRPGANTVAIQFLGTAKDDLVTGGLSNRRATDFTVKFIVGNTAINEVLRLKHPDAPLLPENEEKGLCKDGQIVSASIPPAEGGGGSEPGGGTGEPGEGGGDPGAPAVPSIPANEAAKAIETTWNNRVPATIIDHGHMDLASYGTSADKAGVVLRDDQIPSQTVWRPSGTFALPVPDSTWMKVPAEFAQLAAAAPNGIWSLPQTQDYQLPWLGFSTERLDYSKIEGPVNLSIGKLEGPGRMMTTQSVLGGINILMDSADLNKTVNYSDRTHDHQGFVFTAPGLYVATFDYQWKLKGQETLVKRSMTVSFLVGDTSITAGRSASTAAVAAGVALGGTVGAPDSEGGQPGPTPTPTPKPTPTPTKTPTPKPTVKPTPKPTVAPTVSPGKGKQNLDFGNKAKTPGSTVAANKPANTGQRVASPGSVNPASQVAASASGGNPGNSAANMGAGGVVQQGGSGASGTRSSRAQALSGNTLSGAAALGSAGTAGASSVDWSNSPVRPLGVAGADAVGDASIAANESLDAASAPFGAAAVADARKSGRLSGILLGFGLVGIIGGAVSLVYFLRTPMKQ